MTPERRHVIERIATTAAVLSTLAIALGIVVAWAGYAGTTGEPYSPFNHWISELGQPGVSARAPVFNVALVVGGTGFVVFMVGLAMASPSRLRWVIGPVGAISGIGGAFVGIFPMNHPTEHLVAASTFFDLGWIAVGLASITFVRLPDPRFPRWLAVIGAANVVAFVAFLVSLRVDEYSRQRMAATGPVADRPDAWIAPILEWAVLVGIMAWTLMAGLAWRRTLTARQLAKGAR